MRSCDDFSGATKIFLGWIGGLGAMVGQIVPPVVCIIPEAEIESMHRVSGAIGRQPAHDGSGQIFDGVGGTVAGGEAVKPISNSSLGIGAERLSHHDSRQMV